MTRASAKNSCGGPGLIDAIMQVLMRLLRDCTWLYNIYVIWCSLVQLRLKISSNSTEVSLYSLWKALYFALSYCLSTVPICCCWLPKSSEILIVLNLMTTTFESILAIEKIIQGAPCWRKFHFSRLFGTLFFWKLKLECTLCSDCSATARYSGN